MLEIVQADVQGTGFLSSSARFWVNKVASSIVFFGANGDPTISTGQNATLEICGLFDSTNTNQLDPNLQGYYDLLNFVWFQGALGLYPNTGNSIIIS